jgi:hypothetical protein
MLLASCLSYIKVANVNRLAVSHKIAAMTSICRVNCISQCLRCIG